MKTQPDSPPKPFLHRVASGFRNLFTQQPATAPTQTAKRKRKPEPRRKFGWAVLEDPEGTAPHVAWVRAAIADPKIQELMLITPQVSRELKPICHMLGIEQDQLRWPPGYDPKRKRKPKTPPAAALAIPPDLLLIGQDNLQPPRMTQETRGEQRANGSSGPVSLPH